LHCIEEKRTKEPPYFPLDISEFQTRYDHRGYSLNIVKSHIQDIAENGADFMHFLYVHTWIIPKLVRSTWDPKWYKATDADIKEKLKHKVPYINDHRLYLFNKFVNESNKHHIGIVSLDCSLSILGSKPIFFFNLIGFQLGPSLVYLFLKSWFFETLFFHHITQNDKFHQDVYHEIFTSRWMPYFASALYLRLEAGQVENDGVVWDNKKFGFEPYYNTDNEADVKFKEWRDWYGLNFEGCKEAEQDSKKIDDW